MKILISAILTLLVVMAQPAAAQWRNHGGRHSDGGRHFDVQAQRQRPGGYERQQPQRDFRQPERQRDFRQPDYQRDYRQPDRRPDGRMTDEERSNLRRDLDRANREIYKGR